MAESRTAKTGASDSNIEAGSVTLPDGRSVAFEVSGREHAGTPAILLRPLAGTMALWGTFRELMAARMCVIAFDPPGTGGSSDGALDLTTRAMAADPVHVLDHLGVAKAHVFGLSFGAMVATWLSIDAPARVARLCLASAGARGLDLSVSGLARGVAMAGCLLEPGGEVESCMTEQVLSRGVREGDPARVEAIARQVEADPTDREALLKHALAAARHDASGEVHRITAPTLVLAGDRDELFGTEPQTELARVIPGARLVIVRGAGHDVTLEQPQRTAELLLAFFLDED